MKSRMDNDNSSPDMPQVSQVPIVQSPAAWCFALASTICSTNGTHAEARLAIDLTHSVFLSPMLTKN